MLTYLKIFEEGGFDQLVQVIEEILVDTFNALIVAFGCFYWTSWLKAIFISMICR